MQGKGYATEAVRAALAWADANLAERRITCIIEDANKSSLGVAAKSGFKQFAIGDYRGEPILMFERLRG